MNDPPPTTTHASGAPAANALVTYLQSAVESDRAALSQRLHDELGGLLVASIMDASMAEKNLTIDPHEAALKLQRVRRSLESAIALKRQVVEALRPTLLDNFGLCSALNWLLKTYCAGTDLQRSETYPPDDVLVAPAIAISLYRVVETALNMVIPPRSATRVSLEVIPSASTLTLVLAHDGSFAAEGDERTNLEREAMTNRIRSLGGEFDITHAGQSPVTLRVVVPIAWG